MDESTNLIVMLIAGVIGIIMLFAQVQLFTIAKEVKRIRELMEDRAKKE
jgi:Tfp pilus assembly protein PilW